MAEPRDRKLTVMLTDTEQMMLRELAEARGAKLSDVVRTCIREKHAELPPKGAAKKRGTRKK